MNGASKEAFINIIKSDISSIRNNVDDIKKNFTTGFDETLEYLRSLLEQIPAAISGPLITKTPKVQRKNELKRIETIPEDESIHDVSKTSTAMVEEIKIEANDDMPPIRASRRAAYQKATSNMKKLQSITLHSKLRRPNLDDEDNTPIQKTTRPSRLKRTKSVIISSDEEEQQRPSKFTKHRLEDVGSAKIIPKIEPDDSYVASVTLKEHEEEKEEAMIVDAPIRASRNKRGNGSSAVQAVVEKDNKKASKKTQESTVKKNNVVNSTMDIPENMDVTVEPSMYEDAIGKSIPMNSTMNPNTTVTIDRKMMNVTVVLEPIPRAGSTINETVTIKKSKSGLSSGKKALVVDEITVNNIVSGSPNFTKAVMQSKKTMHNRMKAFRETVANSSFDALITEDESSPERHEDVKSKKKAKQPKEKKQKERITRSSIISNDDHDDDSVPATPPRTVRDPNGMKILKNTYKPNALFSPYAKDSVKKRVEAFEQAGLNSPKSGVDVEAPTRVTRTKTRAMAAAEANDTQTRNSITAIKAARKSLAKAKKVKEMMKERKEMEEAKENNILSSAQKISRLVVNDKLAQKQQQRTTPTGKSRLQMPMSVNRIYHTPAGSQNVHLSTKAATVVKSNIITSVDSFIAPPRPLTKSISNDNLAEKKRKINDEDARRKRDEQLKALTEEKKRKREEKELKNKLAREAKDKLDMEKRLKQEREREEKARVAQILQDKQREESERKKLHQLQRAQEKEERRRQEEQFRLQRLQEQEEAERQLAEQKRREQEADRRRLQEARVQQLAAAEAARAKAQYLAKAKNMAMKNQQGPTTYKLDSEPDEDDDSDDEAKPKHAIPYWALPNVRRAQLKIQDYIPMAPILLFFDSKKCTPNLMDMFKGIRRECLQRTSSANWKTPPRYSMLLDENGKM